MYAIVDIETTGGFAGRNKITEIAIYVHDGERVIREFCSLINPERSIPGYISLLTGIDDAMVADAPRFYEVAKEIQEVTDGCIFVAHSVGFDYGFVRNEFKELGGKFQRKKLCTVRLSRKIVPGLPSYSLGNLCQSLDIQLRNRHRAFGDAQATVTLFEYLLENDHHGIIQEALHPRSREGLLPPNLPPEQFHELPEDAGVYYFLDKQGKPIYIGKAKNIKDRVTTHLGGQSRKAAAMKFETYQLSYELCGNELTALLLESHEIKKFWPRYNRAQKYTSQNWGICTYFDQNGYCRFAVSRVKEQSQALMVFKNFDEAWGFLRTRVERHELCPKLSGMQKVAGLCFDYQIKKCKGACQGKESVDMYNSRAAAATEEMQSLSQSFFIFGRGREPEESSVVWVDDGKYQGFGYLDHTINDANLEVLKSCVKSYDDNQDIQRIIRGYLSKPHPGRVLKI